MSALPPARRRRFRAGDSRPRATPRRSQRADLRVLPWKSRREVGTGSRRTGIAAAGARHLRPLPREGQQRVRRGRSRPRAARPRALGGADVLDVSPGASRRGSCDASISRKRESYPGHLRDLPYPGAPPVQPEHPRLRVGPRGVARAHVCDLPQRSRHPPRRGIALADVTAARGWRDVRALSRVGAHHPDARSAGEGRRGLPRELPRPRGRTG